MPNPDAAPSPKHPERAITVAHAPRLAQGGLATLFALDERLGTIVGRAREPGIGLMRLVWWRDAMAALDAGPPPAEPLLAAIAALRPDRIAGSELATIAAGWEELLDDPDLGGATAQAHARERGARLFLLAGRILGRGDDARLAAAGEGWALVDLARHFAPAERRDALLDQARKPLEDAMATQWPRSLRPLGMLAVLARDDSRRGAAALRQTASRRRLLRMLAYHWIGR